MRFAGLPLLFMISTAPVSAGGVNLLFVNAGTDSAEGSSLDAYIDLSLGDTLSVNASAARVDTNDSVEPFVTRQQQAGVAASHSLGGGGSINWSLGFREWGKDEAIETRDLLLHIGHRKRRFSLSLGYESGEIELFLDPVLMLPIRSIVSDRSAWRVNAGYDTDGGAAWISLLVRDYEKNLPAIDQRRRLQRGLDRVALSQAYALSEEEYSIGYEWYGESTDIGIDYSRTVSVLDRRDNSYAGVNLRVFLSRSLLADLRVDREFEDGLTTVTAGIGYAW